MCEFSSFHRSTQCDANDLEAAILCLSNTSIELHLIPELQIQALLVQKIAGQWNTGAEKTLRLCI